MNKLLDIYHRHSFLFLELVKRDFKKKYKRTYLGILWSLLSPLLTLLVMRVVFTSFFGTNIEHYTTYLFCGNIVWSFFSDATNGGMSSLMDNAAIFSKINVPKYLFLFSRNLSSLINFGMTFVVFLIFCLADGVAITPLFLMLTVPVALLILFNIGVGLILSAMFVFFRDVQYLWGVFLTLLMYLSAIFYDPAVMTIFGIQGDKLLMFNPVYTYISYFREIVLYGSIPGWQHHLLAIGFAVGAFGIGALIYKKMNHKFLYYI
jgi:ABC-2 type transport system permease protein